MATFAIRWKKVKFYWSEQCLICFFENNLILIGGKCEFRIYAAFLTNEHHFYHVDFISKFVIRWLIIPGAE